MANDFLEADFDDAGNLEDPSSFDFSGFFGGLLNNATRLGQSYLEARNRPQPQQVRLPPAPVPLTRQPWFLPVLLGGGALVLLVFAGLLFGGRK